MTVHKQSKSDRYKTLCGLSMPLRFGQHIAYEDDFVRNDNLVDCKECIRLSHKGRK